MLILVFVFVLASLVLVLVLVLVGLVLVLVLVLACPVLVNITGAHPRGPLKTDVKLTFLKCHTHKMSYSTRSSKI